MEIEYGLIFFHAQTYHIKSDMPLFDVVTIVSPLNEKCKFMSTLKYIFPIAIDHTF